MLIVSDTSPLRALQALNKVQLLGSLYSRALIPPAVAVELSRSTESIDAFPAADYPFVSMAAPRNSELVNTLRRSLDAGESEAIALAAETPNAVLLIDEATGRRVAGSMGISMIGVLGVLVRAKHAGLVVAVAPLLDDLDRTIDFRVSSQLRESILRFAGESQGS